MKLKYTKFQKIIEFITIILLFSMSIYLITSWSELPSKIPAHYNGEGVADRFGNKSELLVLPIVSVVLYILLTVVSFFPRSWNIPVKITEENKELVYYKVKDMLILLKMQIIIIFYYILYCGVKCRDLGIWFTPVALITVFGTIIYYIIKVNKSNFNKDS